jgi:DNA-binding CsgD family transcriptional regulator
MIAELAAIAAAAGSPDFYRAALTALGRLLDCKRQLAVRYAQYARPQFLVNLSLDHGSEAIYLSDLYRLDPLMHYVRKPVAECVLTMAQLHLAEPSNPYFDELYRSAAIFDELVVLLPAVGGVWVALCLDLDERHFDPEEIALVRQLYPLIERLHDLHIDRCLFGRRGGYLSDSQLAVMLQDNEAEVRFRNTIWTQNVSADAEQTILGVSRGLAAGIHSLGERDIVHWETLESTHAVAPAGKIFMAERHPSGHADLNIDQFLLGVSAEFRLTPRETQIVQYSLRGFSNSAIADHLKVSTGTVRNHKHRLYFKLDVTSEREIASLIFARIFDRQTAAKSALDAIIRGSQSGQF